MKNDQITKLTKLLWEFISVDWGRYVSTVVFDVQFLSIKKYVSLNSINDNLNVHEHIDF